MRGVRGVVRGWLGEKEEKGENRGSYAHRVERRKKKKREEKNRRQKVHHLLFVFLRLLSIIQLDHHPNDSATP